MPRNVFENNDPEVSEEVLPEVSPEDALELGNKVHSLLPPLVTGHHYRLTDLSNGRTAVVVEPDEDDSQKRDLYGRHKL